MKTMAGLRYKAKGIAKVCSMVRLDTQTGSRRDSLAATVSGPVDWADANNADRRGFTSSAAMVEGRRQHRAAVEQSSGEKEGNWWWWWWW